MVTIRYSDAKGWHDAKVGPRGPLTLDPATAVLHYAQEIFEGLKAYRLADGGMALFRPEQNARRFQRSAKRLAMPELPEDMFLQACKQLIAVDKDLVETRTGTIDRRQKLLRLTPEGGKFEAQLFEALRSSLASAYAAAGQESVTGFWRVLEGLIPAEDKAMVIALQKDI